ncbi:hypothetical protein, partial [Enterococcus faecalis]|uniref:hypothetical protein n=1 Tax=Enterococcus faecalis TaxID=1351 RepID=UPI003D6AC28A
QISFQINYSDEILITNVNMETMHKSEPPLALVRGIESPNDDKSGNPSSTREWIRLRNALRVDP